jgi:hypothetical protein
MSRRGSFSPVSKSSSLALGRVDGFDENNGAGKCDESSVVLAVFSHRSAMRLKRLSFTMVCSIRARVL